MFMTHRRVLCISSRQNTREDKFVTKCFTYQYQSVLSDTFAKFQLFKYLKNNLACEASCSRMQPRAAATSKWLNSCAATSCFLQPRQLAKKRLGCHDQSRGPDRLRASFQKHLSGLWSARACPTVLALLPRDQPTLVGNWDGYLVA